jgi:hypothetical protein
MTWPVTPNPGIHNVPQQDVAQSSAFTVQQFGTWAQQLLLAFTQGVINALLNGLGLGSFVGPVDKALADVESALSSLVSTGTISSQNWTTLFTDLGLSAPTATELATYLSTAESDATSAITQIQDFLSTGNWADLSQAFTDFAESIFGGQASLSLTGSVAAPAVTNVSQNVQPVWDFPNAESVAGGSGWVWDGTRFGVRPV